MACRLLELPVELRQLIYAHVLPHDITQFAATSRRPSLLNVSRFFRSEYSKLLFGPRVGRHQNANGQAMFGDEHVTVQTYYHETDSWCTVTDVAAKLDIFERCDLNNLYDITSLASAQRACRNVHEVRFSRCRIGILVINMPGGPRWWMWMLDG